MQVKKLVNEAEELDSIREELVEETSRQEAEAEVEVGFRISKTAVDRRRSKPTGEGSCGVHR
jgi:hypothetical protein